MFEELDPGDGGTFAATGLPCWCWLEFAGTGGEGPAAYGKYPVHFDTCNLICYTSVSLNFAVWW